MSILETSPEARSMDHRELRSRDVRDTRITTTFSRSGTRRSGAHGCIWAFLYVAGVSTVLQHDAAVQFSPLLLNAIPKYIEDTQRCDRCRLAWQRYHTGCLRRFIARSRLLQRLLSFTASTDGYQASYCIIDRNSAASLFDLLTQNDSRRHLRAGRRKLIRRRSKCLSP
jgi:hypothetical protein